MNAVLQEHESCQSVQDGLAWTEAGQVATSWEAVRRGWGWDKAPPGATARSTDWRALTVPACCADKIYVTWRPVGFEGQQKEGDS